MSIPKLFQWVLVLGSSMSVWLAYVCGVIQPVKCSAFHDVLVILPLYFLISFACYSVAVIGYRVANINDCRDAAREIQGQIAEAHNDLEKKGFKYVSDWKQ